MNARILVLAAITFMATPSGSTAAPAPQPRKKAVTTTKGAAPTKGSAPTKAWAPRHIGKIRKGKIPDAGARVVRKRVAVPNKRLIALKAARKPVRLADQPKPVKVSFTPCAASLPPQAPRVVAAKAGMDSAVFDRAYRWPTGARLKVGFLDGSRAAREAVALTASAWSESANIQFDFSLAAKPSNPDILIRFDAEGCTSHVGTSSRYYAEIGEPSMHLCHMDQWVGNFDPADGPSALPEGFRRVVLHEFGHALGLQHEHQSPQAQFEWNKEVVYDFYGTSYGWDRDYVNLWVFRTIEPQLVDVSQYDPLSIMHYAFPAEFTTNGVAFGGSHELSGIDKEHISKEYPRKATTKARRKLERKIAVRNDTAFPLDVQVIHETSKGKKATWVPTNEPASSPAVRVAAGTERMLDGQGRRVKVLARSADGRSTWSHWAETPLRISPKGGYLDVEVQTYVIVIDGPADPPTGQTRDELYAAASQALAKGEHDDARALFEDFTERFPSDAFVPWARFNIVLSWYEQERWDEALQSSYALIVDHPRADATIYAWYYGGLAALQLGWCDGARGYLEYVEDEQSGAPEEWRASSRQYLEAVEKDPARWCW